MKVKLLRKLRERSESELKIQSITTTNGTVSGMKYRYNDDCYKGIFSYGDTGEEVMNKVFRIYLNKNIEAIRTKYRKYSANYKNQKNETGNKERMYVE